MPKRFPRFLILIIAIAMMLGVFLSGCEAAETFIPIPPPVEGGHPLVVIVRKIGEIQEMDVAAPFAEVQFDQTGDFPGGVRMEQYRQKYSDQEATMLSYRWGTWDKTSIERFESYDQQGNLLGGWVEQSLDEASILQWVQGCGTCTLDRSRLVFEYIAPSPGEAPLLENVYYIEQMGLTRKNPMAFGSTHRWSNNLETIFPTQIEWGFWETKRSPFMQMVEALESAKTALRTETPTFTVVDHDSAGRELLGRQTGMDIYRDGVKTGSIIFTYNNTWGLMPNTKRLGSGSLSQIEWVEGKDDDEEYYSIVVLSASLSPEPTSIYMFCSTRECADHISRNQQEWPMLYEQARNDEINGLDFLVYSGGHVGNIKGTDSSGDSVTVGSGGGVFYSTLGDPTFDDVDYAYNKLNLLGLNGVKALGLHYPSHEASGSGLWYYLAIVRLSLAPADQVLDIYGLDVGSLDRVGLMR